VAREERICRSHHVVASVLAPEDVADEPPAVEHAVGEDLGGEFLIDRRDLIRSIAKGKHGCHQASGGRACSEWISLFFFSKFQILRCSVPWSVKVEYRRVNDLHSSSQLSTKLLGTRHLTGNQILVGSLHTSKNARTADKIRKICCKSLDDLSTQRTLDAAAVERDDENGACGPSSNPGQFKF
jgi:hypothetical protein